MFSMESELWPTQMGLPKCIVGCPTNRLLQCKDPSPLHLHQSMSIYFEDKLKVYNEINAETYNAQIIDKTRCYLVLLALLGK